MDNGWRQSAEAWADHLAQKRDFGRQFVLDKPMLARTRRVRFEAMLDVGCGEGRFCRLVRDHISSVTGIDPTEELLALARNQDPDGDYRSALAEDLPFADSSFDLVVSYLTLLDIPDYKSALREMARVLEPGGTLLIANMNGFCTAGPDEGWQHDETGKAYWVIDDYMKERSYWAEWRGIRIRNWHRPMSEYISELLGLGLQLTLFDEPRPHGGPEAKQIRYLRVPYFHIMEWTKPQ